MSDTALELLALAAALVGAAVVLVYLFERWR